MLQWILFVIHKINSSVNIRLYVHKLLILYKKLIEKVQKNNQTIIQFVNLWSKTVPVNISYPRTVNQINEYLDAMNIPTCIRCIISRYNQINNKKGK